MFHIKLIIFWHVFSLCFEPMVSANFCSSCCSCNKAVTTSCYHCNHLNGCQAHAHTRQLLGCIPTLLPLQPFKWLPGPYTRQLLWLYTHYPRCFLCNHLNGWQAHTRQLLWLFPLQPYKWLAGSHQAAVVAVTSATI